MTKTQYYKLDHDSSAVESVDAAATEDEPSSEQNEIEEEDSEEERTCEELTATEIMQAHGCIELDSVPIDHRELDEAEELLIQSPCCSTITADYY